MDEVQSSEIYKLCDESEVVNCINRGRLRGAGHVMRLEDSDTVKKVHCTKPGGNGDRRRGR